MAFVRFMVSGVGRGLRIVGGLAVAGGGIYLITLLTVWSIIGGAIMAAVGCLFFCAGAFDFCVLSPFFGYSFSGPKTREQLARPAQPSPVHSLT